MLLSSRLLIIGWLAVLLVGCASTPEQSVAVAPKAGQNSQQHVNALIAAADKAAGAERYRLRLQAADLSLKIRNYEQADEILTQMPVKDLDAESYVKHHLINSLIATHRGDYFVAKDKLTDKRLSSYLLQITPELGRRVREERARVFAEGADYQAAVRERVFLSTLLDQPAARDKNADTLWQILMEMPNTELTSGLTSSRQSETQGWYTLALASKNNQSDLHAQQQALDSWIKNWPDHPAGKRLPVDLRQIKELLGEQAKHIAVLLPQSGKLEPAANAIRDGILAAYYQQATGNRQMPKLRFYNTEGRNTNVIYDEAVADGAQLIIGPLEKERVSELAQRPNLSVPTIALNTLDGQARAQPQLFQIGLAVEDEAKQIAAQAWREGKRQALILAPSNSLGDRNLATFTATWRALGGTVINEFRFGANSDFTELAKRALQIDQSEERARQLQQIVGPVQVDPQRRTDVDMIFAVVQPEQARLLKPSLTYYFAGDLPLYATSAVYTGENQNTRNQDMQGLRFLTLPWYFDTQSVEKQALTSSETNPNFSRLNALGADVFNLSPRLKQLQKAEESSYFGYTGKLHLNSAGQFERHLSWATFDSAGNARLLGDGSHQDEGAGI